MGKRGPAGKPTNLRMLHGDRKDRINTDEPIPADGLPELPDGVSDEVATVWEYTVAQLAAMHCVSPADRDPLLAYCEAVVTHRRASRMLARSNVIAKAAKGDGVVKNPLVQVQRDAAILIRILGREFGLTPSARSDMTGARGNDGQGADRLLS